MKICSSAFFSTPKTMAGNEQWYTLLRNAVECRYNAIQYNMILHALLPWLSHNINESLDQRASYGVSFGRILEKMTAL